MILFSMPFHGRFPVRILIMVVFKLAASPFFKDSISLRSSRLQYLAILHPKKGGFMTAHDKPVAPGPTKGAPSS
jgi:hypothetical protein